MKRSFIFFLTLLLCSSAWAGSRTINRPASVTLSSDPTIVHFKMNDDAASTTLTDSSGNARNATLSANSSTLTTTGKIGKAIDFGGTQNAEIADADVYSFGDGTDDTPFSICAWGDFDASSAHQFIAGKFTSATSNREWWFEMHDSDALMLWLHDESTDGYIYAFSSVLTAGTYHWCATYDGSEAETGITLYVNGVEDTDSQTEGGGGYVALENNTLPFSIGATSNEAYDFNSWLDDVRLFNKELSALEVADLYNAGAGTEGLFSNSNALAFGTSALVQSEHNLNTGNDLVVEGSVEVKGALYAAQGMLPPKVTADPCGDTVKYPEGSIFYNDTSNYHCFCNDSGADIKTNDNSTACF